MANVVETAKLIRAELKKEFPGVKFSVRSTHGSVSIRWTDFPLQDAVDAVVRKYASVSYDEFTGEILSGGNLYVFAQNEWSKETRAMIETLIPDCYTKNDFGWYRAFNKAAEELQKRLQQQAPAQEQPKKETAPKVERKLEGEATKRQLWAIHKATGLDTSDLQITKQEASSLIGRSMNGENITPEVSALLGIEEAPTEVEMVSVEEQKNELVKKLDDISTYTISQQLQDREHEQSMFRRTKIDRTAEIQHHFDTYTTKVIEIIERADIYTAHKLANALQRYKKKYYALYTRMLQHRAHNPSWAVTGRGNLNTIRYNKKMEQYDKMLGESVTLTKWMDAQLNKCHRSSKKVAS